MNALEETCLGDGFLFTVKGNPSSSARRLSWFRPNPPRPPTAVAHCESNRMNSDPALLSPRSLRYALLSPQLFLISASFFRLIPRRYPEIPGSSREVGRGSEAMHGVSRRPPKPFWEYQR
jgi:hypothetical protein